MTNQTIAPINLNSRFQILLASFFAFIASYLAAELGGLMVLRPQMIWPLWPGCALLTAMLLWTPRKLWPAILVAGLAGFALYDLREGLSLRATALFLAADAVEVLIAALGVTYMFGGVPRLHSVKSLAKYSLFAVVLAPVSVASVAATGSAGEYHIAWRIGFLTEALAQLTLTPAILNWIKFRLTPAERQRARYREAALMSAGLLTLAYVTFAAPGIGNRPALLYSLVPFLMWAALRFGTRGTSNSLVFVALVAIFGAIHGRGPFTGDTPIHNVMSLQLFLLFAASSFMVLAAVVEQRTTAEQGLRESEERFRLVADSAPGLIWMSGTDKLCNYFNRPWLQFTGRTFDEERGSGWATGVHPDDLHKCLETYNQSFDRLEKFAREYRLRRHDGQYRYLLDIGVPRFSQDGSFAGYIGIAVDVTERKEAEQALRDINRTLERQTALLQSREELLKIFVKSVPAGVAMFDRDMRYLQVSDRWCADYKVDASQILGRSQYEVFSDMPDRWKEMHRRALKGETLRCDEDSWEHNGVLFWTRWELRPWTNLDGTQGGIIIFAEDITHRKQVDQALRASEERLRLAQQIGRIGTFERNVTTGVLTWSAEMESLYGLPAGAFARTDISSFENLVHIEDRAGVMKLIDQALETGNPIQGEWRIPWPDGTLHWIAGRWQAFMDESGTPTRVVGVNMDLTERKLAEEALRASEEKFAKAFRESPMALTLTSADDHRYLDVNETFERLTGWSRDEVVGLTPFDIQIWVNDTERRAMVRRLREQGSVRELEVHYRRKDGAQRIGLGSAELIEISKQQCVLSVIADITDRKQAEEALRTMSGKLIEAQEQERTRIARELHDDINQRLALVAVRIAQMYQDAQVELATQTELYELHRDIGEISADLQSLSHRLHSSKLEYLGAVAAMKGWCREFGERQRTQIMFKDNVHSFVPPEIGLCLFRVLQEALQNATKYSGVKHVDVTLTEDSNKLQLVVRDSGKGFDVDAAKQGSGLGLTSMQERVRTVNGTLAIQSKPMGGTTVQVSVPLGSEDKSYRTAG
jgi:PAS domain S-box-containing protein